MVVSSLTSKKTCRANTLGRIMDAANEARQEKDFLSAVDRCAVRPAKFIKPFRIEALLELVEAGLAESATDSHG
jgi:hypothetical protein